MKDQGFLQTAVEAAQQGGLELVKVFGKLDSSQVGLKGEGDYVTESDRASEEVIIQAIRNRFPDHGFLGEEGGVRQGTSEYVWCIDPLDGTANFVQGIAMFAVSVALMKGEEVVVGVVYEPIRNEIFQAEQGKGAFLNNVPIRVVEKKDMSRAMLASGFPWRSKAELDSYLLSFRALFLQSAGIRRMGAASLDLAWTACGRFDGFWEMRLHPWDIAAGILLVREAGGKVSEFAGGNGYFRSGNVVAGSPFVHGRMVEVTRSCLSGIS